MQNSHVIRDVKNLATVDELIKNDPHLRKLNDRLAEVVRNAPIERIVVNKKEKTTRIEYPFAVTKLLVQISGQIEHRTQQLYMAYHKF